MHQLQIEDSLSKFGILKNLNEEQVHNLSNNGLFVIYRKNDKIYREGVEGNSIYFILKGKVKLASNTSTGHQLIKDVLHENFIFGENIFGAQRKRTEFAVAFQGDVSLLVVPKSEILKILSQNHLFMKDMMDLSVARLQNLEKRVENFIFKKAKSRISDFLYRMGNKQGIKIGVDEMLINHGLSHKEIANLTDTSRQTVARVLGELKKANLIHFSSRKPSKILIRNMQNLAFAN